VNVVYISAGRCRVHIDIAVSWVGLSFAISTHFSIDSYSNRSFTVSHLIVTILKIYDYHPVVPL